VPDNSINIGLSPITVALEANLHSKKMFLMVLFCLAVAILIPVFTSFTSCPLDVEVFKSIEKSLSKSLSTFCKLNR
jgi:hypothetical protein